MRGRSIKRYWLGHEFFGARADGRLDSHCSPDQVIDLDTDRGVEDAGGWQLIDLVDDGCGSELDQADIGEEHMQRRTNGIDIEAGTGWPRHCSGGV